MGRWEVRAEVWPAPVEPAGPDLATLDAGALGEELLVRTWREGDRMRPLGMDGTKTLQDLFTDRGVPRSLRYRLPVVTAAGHVVWVAGVAVSEDFRLGPQALPRCGRRRALDDWGACGFLIWPRRGGPLNVGEKGSQA